jgi:hypothetical protein
LEGSKGRRMRRKQENIAYIDAKCGLKGINRR